MINHKLEPTQVSERIPSLDFLRGIAILGILFINSENFAYPDSWSPWSYGFNGAIDHTARFWVYFLTQGKFYSMFALLFGVGFYLFLERLQKKGLGTKALDIYSRRMLWLFIIGIVHAYLIWDGDILYHYAICGFLLLPFRSLKSKYLVAVIIVLSLLLLIRSYDQIRRRQGWQKTYETAIQVPENLRTEGDRKDIAFWQKLTTPTKPIIVDTPIPKRTYWSGIKKNYEHASVHKGMLYNQGLLFPTLILMILGILLYRSGIFYDYKSWKHYWLICFGIVGLGLIMNYMRYYHWTYTDQEPVVHIWQGWLFTFPREFLGFGYVLLLNGIYQKFLSRVKTKLISNIGRTALSNYILQSILLGLFFYGYGLEMFNKFSRFELLGIVGVFWCIQIVLSWVWLNYHKQGTLEWLWKKLTYERFNSQDIETKGEP